MTRKTPPQQRRHRKDTRNGAKTIQSNPKKGQNDLKIAGKHPENFSEIVCFRMGALLRIVLQFRIHFMEFDTLILHVSVGP